MRLALLIVLLLLACPSYAELDERIQVTIEEPAQGERYSGISNLRGWAVSPEGMGSYLLNVYIDGEFAFRMAHYGQRTDVGNAFPDYPDSDTGGFSMAFNYKNLTPGEHEIRVRAFDNAGNYNDAVTTFTAERFVSPFIGADSQVNVTTLDRVYFYDNQSLLLNGVTVEGNKWDFVLRWDKASQSFKTWGIEAYGGDLNNAGNDYNPGSGSGSGSGSNWEVYACITSPESTAYSSSEYVVMKNGLQARNNAGKSWYSYDEHVVFKTETGRWYSIEEQSDFFRLDVVAEPTSCFDFEEYEYHSVETRSSNEKAVIFEGEGEVIVGGSCGLTVDDPLTYYATGTITKTQYLVSLRSGEDCLVKDVIEY